MKSAEVRRKYLDFFKARGHVEIPSAPLIPENDPTTLFISAGMQPLVQNILGQPHPAGKRLVDSQKAVRLQDIDEVGDLSHTTFFEMLGNWSLGDYFKKEQLPWIFEFLTKELNLPQERLYVSIFEGTAGVPKDEESVGIWKKLGIPEERTFYYGVDKNWWSRAGEPEKMPAGEPGGPDSEVFYDFGPELKLHENSPYKNEKCHPNCQCGRFLEIANSVFMQYQKQKDGSLKELKQKSVDFGGGLERMVAATENQPDIFYTDLFLPIIAKLQELNSHDYRYNVSPTLNRYFRIAADHMKASIMLIKEGIQPSNKLQGYVLRRLLRKAIWYGRNYLFVEKPFTAELVDTVISIYNKAYPTSKEKIEEIKLVLKQEEAKFQTTVDKGKKELVKVAEKLSPDKIATGKLLFAIYETYGLFPDVIKEELEKNGWLFSVDLEKEFILEKEKHQELSRTAAAGMFKGGLADHGQETTKLHTATHLLHQALRTILGNHVSQKGSNITSERLRFDFSHPTKLTSDELKQVENLVNEKIKENLPVSFKIMDKAEALKSGALAFFGEKYSEKVKVHTIGDPKNKTVFSREICGGPHVGFTGELGHFTITKEESAGSGIRRIYAVTRSSR